MACRTVVAGLVFLTCLVAWPAVAEDPEESIRATVRNFYAAYSGRDHARLRTLVTDDYRLLESGELLDIEGDIAGMPAEALHPTRTDSFDFRQVQVDGGSAHAVYFLASELYDDQRGARSRRWLESVVLRQVDGHWRVALLHSTPIPPAAASIAAAVETPSATDWPMWAYGITTLPQPGDTAVPQRAPGPWVNPDLPIEEQTRLRQVKGSTQWYSLAQLYDQQHAPDWFPEQHGPVPAAISRGPASLGDQTRACGGCHRINGGGRPENAPVYGLPVTYFLRQMDDFRAGRRHSADPRKPNLPTMIAMARALSEDEARAVAEFWSRQDGGPPIQVIETDRVPPTRLRSNNLYVRTALEPLEPLGERILEVPEHLDGELFLDDPRAGHIAYVPPGSLARGRALAETGRDADGATPVTLPCTSCHGADLLGAGEAPPIAGRSPSYAVRQLHGFKTGARDGSMALLMQPVVARLDAGQMLAISAYLASLPRGPRQDPD
ncbi:MAG: c-type cytochrome [Rhodanobacteraceae bacterium]|nr:c-type cytochrome [Rhodanobacteraceae bacterium]